MEPFITFLQENRFINIGLDAYFVWVVVFFLLNFVLRDKKVIGLFLSVTLIYVIYSISALFELKISSFIFYNVVSWLPLAIVVIMAPDIRKALETVWKGEGRKEIAVSSSEHTKRSIVEAMAYLSARKIGALITIEKFNSLEQYSEKAIQMDSDVSKELLINIFSPLTPLHDGTVIIRGNKIVCAAAYYVLTETSDFDKTIGSRHRAALGISEVSDSMTLVVSEESGDISIAIEGIILKVSDKAKLLEYIEMFMK